MIPGVPYKLRGNSVVKSDSGEVVKSHPSREKALAHLRALKANVEESAGGVLGALLEGAYDEARHPRGPMGRWIATFHHSVHGTTTSPIEARSSAEAMSKAQDLARQSSGGRSHMTVQSVVPHEPHGGFKIGDVVTHETGSREAGGHGPVTFTKQPGLSTVVGLQRNGNLRLKHPATGTTHDVHHSHAQKVSPLHPDYRGKVVQDAYAAQRAEIEREKAARARSLPTSRRATLGKAEGDAAARTRAEILAKSPGAAADLARHQSIARGAREPSKPSIDHAKVRGHLENLPEGRYFHVGGLGNGGALARKTSAGIEVYRANQAKPEKVHKTPSAAAGHMMRIRNEGVQRVREAAPDVLGALLEGC